MKFSPPQDSPAAPRARAHGSAFLRARGAHAAARRAAGRSCWSPASPSGSRAAATSRPTTPMWARRRCSSRRTFPARSAKVLVREGEHVAAGDDAVRDRSGAVPARARAARRASSIRCAPQFANLKSNYASLNQLVAARPAGGRPQEARRRSQDRAGGKPRRLAGGSRQRQGGAAHRRAAAAARPPAARQHAQPAARQSRSRDRGLSALSRRPRRRSTRRSATSTTRCVKAPIAGTATQVDNIQLGRFVTAGMPVFSVIDDAAPWVDANPKETDITYLRRDQKVDIEVDSFPDRTFHGTVASVSPGTGAQFAILPPQNANGNWVKVVQRVPVRIVFDPGAGPVAAARRHERQRRHRHRPAPHASRRCSAQARASRRLPRKRGPAGGRQDARP